MLSESELCRLGRLRRPAPPRGTEVTVVLKERGRPHQPKPYIAAALGASWKAAGAPYGHFVIQPMAVMQYLIYARFRNRRPGLKYFVRHISPVRVLKMEEGVWRTANSIALDANSLQKVAQRSQFQVQVLGFQTKLLAQIFNLLLQLHQRKSHLFHLLVSERSALHPADSLPFQ